MHGTITVDNRLSNTLLTSELRQMIKNVQLGIVTCSDDDKLILFNIQAKFAIYIVMRNRNLSYTTLRCKDYASSSCNYLFGQQKR